jgi:4-diphosphocytidyl-2-C-methyl-D-erythritol kinase
MPTARSLAAAEHVPAAPAARVERAPAKVNLTLHVVGRRPDGYHDIESLVAFAAVGDELSFAPAPVLSLDVRGPTAPAIGDVADNLVLKAARALAERLKGARLGRFVLSKRLPVAGGLGGGSADAAAALRLLARANRLPLDDPRLFEAARATGADVPVCLDPCPRFMRGIGDVLSDPLDLPRLPAVLVNPGVAVPTRDVFAALALPPPTKGLARVSHQGAQVGQARLASGEVAERSEAGGGPHQDSCKFTPSPTLPRKRGREQTEFMASLAAGRNDLEAPAIKLQPVIANVLAALRAARNCRLARMSGSGATCFGLFDSSRAAMAAARALREKHSAWWVRATVLAG